MYSAPPALCVHRFGAEINWTPKHRHALHIFWGIYTEAIQEPLNLDCN